MESDERAPLLEASLNQNHIVRLDEDVESMVQSHLTKDEQNLYDASVGERLAYNDYTTIDWLHDLVRFYQATEEKKDKTRTDSMLMNINMCVLLIYIGQGLVSIPIHR